ncbi:MAG: hypothetical protein IKI57_02600 [Clostridia bacterium]|nr:hypothetical protein [Clostridia bacterium]
MAVVQKGEYLLPKNILIIGVSYFFLSGMCFPCGIFRTTTGLFKMAKYSMLTASALNIILSIVFGLKMGLFGIILASLVSRLVTNMWYEPFLLYRKFFEEKVYKYYLNQILRTLLVVALIVAMIPLINMITIEHLYLRIFVKSIVCCSITAAVLLITFFRTDEFKFLLERTVGSAMKLIKEKMN